MNITKEDVKEDCAFYLNELYNRENFSYSAYNELFDNVMAFLDDMYICGQNAEKAKKSK